MPAATRQGNILQIGKTIRIESGPVLRKAEATAKLLGNDVTADHYVEGAFDALAVPIKLGEDMHYLDWLGHSEGVDGATGWYVYQHQPLTKAELAEREVTPEVLAALPDDETRETFTHIWREIGCEPDESAAITLATDTLLAAKD